MAQRFVFVTGLGIGEDSKGASVEFVTKTLGAHTVLRAGGPQSAHYLVTDHGTVALSHFGAGIFQGAHSHLIMPIIPQNLFTEALELEAVGVVDPFSKVTIDRHCLIVTPYHQAMSRLREILRAEKKGTIGFGVGEAIKLSKTHPELAIYAGDLTSVDLDVRVDQTRELFLKWAKILLDQYQGDIPIDAEIEYDHLRHSDLIHSISETYRDFAGLVTITDDRYLAELFRADGTIVCEASHGTLHHPRFGFVPHISQIDPTAALIYALLRYFQYQGQVIRLGALRTHLIRIGAGPLVSFDSELSESLPEIHNQGNAWLGPIRKGAFDIVAFKYSLAINARSVPVSGLLLSHLDSLAGRTEWPICVAYQYHGDATDLDQFFELADGLITSIKLVPDDGTPAFQERQTKLTQYLKASTPVIEMIIADDRSLSQILIERIESSLQVPVVAIAQGPRVGDRLTTNNWHKLFN